MRMNQPRIACDMSSAPDTPEERLAEYRRLFAHALVGRERTADGIRLRLHADDGVEEWVRDLAAREKACCPFFDFRIAIVAGEVHWDATVVDDDLARAMLDEFYAISDTRPDTVDECEDRLIARGLRIATDPSRTVRQVLPPR